MRTTFLRLGIAIGLAWTGSGCAADKPAPTVSTPTTQPTTKPAPFAKEIEAFEAADRKQMPPKDAILFLGSSSIRLWTTLAADFPDQKVINRGFGGSTVADSVRYADRIVIPYQPKRIVFYAGDNDLAAGKSPEQVAADFKELVRKVHAKRPETRIDFISIKPSLARWKIIDKVREANRLIEAYAKEDSRLGYIDVVAAMLGEDGKPKPDIFIADGLHMNRKGYEIWVAIIALRLK